MRIGCLTLVLITGCYTPKPLAFDDDVATDSDPTADDTDEQPADTPEE